MLGDFWDGHGRLLGSLACIFGVPGRLLGVFGTCLGRSWMSLEPLGWSLGDVEAIWGGFWCHLEWIWEGSGMHFAMF